MSSEPSPRRPVKIRYDAHNEFLNDLRARVARYFRMTGRSSGATRSMYVKTIVVLGALVGSYWLLVFWAATWWQALPLAVALGLSVAAVGFNVQHDGSHGAVSRRPWINRLMAMTLDLLGASSMIWARKHNQLHHSYTNLDGHDDDIDLGFLARLSPAQKHRRFHRLQHLYLWVLYTAITVKWQFFDDFHTVARGRIGAYRLKRPRGWSLVQFVAGKAFFFSAAFVVPALFHPLGAVLFFYGIANLAAGLTLSIVFQLAHVVEKTEFPQPAPDGGLPTPWAVHQLRTTADFARDNRLLSWFVGGLNFQVEHHLFPRICHVHYRNLSRIVERACREWGVAYHAFPTLRAALASHYRALRAMGRPPGPPQQARALSA